MMSLYVLGYFTLAGLFLGVFIGIRDCKSSADAWITMGLALVWPLAIIAILGCAIGDKLK